MPNARAIRSTEPTLGLARPRSSWLRKGWESPASLPSCLSVQPRSRRRERTRAPSAIVASSVPSTVFPEYRDRLRVHAGRTCGYGRAVLAYVFWHRPGGDAGPYEERLAAFHAALATHPPDGFRGSAALRVQEAPWLPGDGPVYEDWYA